MGMPSGGLKHLDRLGGCWGGMLHDAYPYLEINPWQTFVPGACIFLAVLSCNFIGEGIRDLLDPRERTRRGSRSSAALKNRPSPMGMVRSSE